MRRVLDRVRDAYLVEHPGSLLGWNRWGGLENYRQLERNSRPRFGPAATREVSTLEWVRPCRGHRTRRSERPASSVRDDEALLEAAFGSAEVEEIEPGGCPSPRACVFPRHVVDAGGLNAV